MQLRETAGWLRKALLDPKWFVACAVCIFLMEIPASLAIIRFVPYTEIDWVAYMQEVGGFINGTWDYAQLHGDTGPLVYPAGFVYVYSALYYVTDRGTDLRLAQYVFVGFYLVHVAMVLSLYCRVAKPLRLPPWLPVFLCLTAYRVHSIFLLRLFNDPIAVMLLYASLHLLLSRHWDGACVVFSLAVSVKMNILLFSPGLLMVLLLALGWSGTIPRLGLCAAVQVLLGAPFMMENPTGYISRAFDLGRQFLFQWTVNWRFLPEWLFLHRGFHLALLSAHLLVLVAFGARHWLGGRGIRALLQWGGGAGLRAEVMVWVMFSSNLVGMAFARSLHYQFYVWYFHSLPLLLFTTRLHPSLSVAVLLVVEWCWNVYPSTVASSLLLHVAHGAVLAALWWAGPPVPTLTKTD